MKKYIVASSLILSACAGSAAPNLINGSYYLAGDSFCKRYEVYTNNMIKCTDKKGEHLNYRTAMSDIELQNYYNRMRLQQQQWNDLGNQIQATGESFQRQAQALQQQTAQYSYPQVMPIQTPNSNSVRCVTIGNITNCRD